MEDERAFIAALTELALERAAPDELVVFEETAEEYFADPQAALTAANQDSAVGFGLELAMITPVALAVGAAVMQALVTALSDRAVTGVSGVLRRVLRKRTPDPADIVLSPDQARYVRQVALDRARSLGMPEQQATLLADSFVGAIATAS
ncbi:hypothetical protein [Allorhizocola rhizosphaerae]|uniref:hypothetical protein n=1 Tax=Allorhizocola rhizosphaerae TaxID=1872709 RepID=UPI000E3D1A71|nr:hypothetical protein [Allorhizocola rhizosphaerae]